MTVANSIEFNELLVKTAQSGARDLHLSVGSQIKAKIDGVLADFQSDVVTDEFLRANVLSKLEESRRQEFDQKGSARATINFGGNLRFRVDVFSQEGKLSSILRYIPPQAKKPLELGLPKVLSNVFGVNRGLVVVGGVSGTGKTTTISSMIEEINGSVSKTISTIEEPIEYLFENKKSLVEQREVKIDCPSFEQGIDDLMKIDVGVAYIGKLKDANCARKILDLSEKCLVVLEMNGPDGVDVLDDYAELFPSEERIHILDRLSSNLVAVLNQDLVPRQGGGELPVFEILLNSGSIASAIKEDRLSRIPDIIKMSGHEGMIDKDRSLAELVKAGEVLLEVALGYASDKENFNKIAAE